MIASSRRLPTLPLDVMYAVLQDAPKPTLLACSVVSRTWREAAVPHLFASIEIARSAGNCSDINKELLDMYPHLTRHIRRLRIVYQKPRWSILPSDEYPIVDSDLLLIFSRRLPRLKEIYLRSLWISIAQPQSPDVLTTYRLNKLTLVDCGAEDRPISSADLHVLLQLASTVQVDMVDIKMQSVERQADSLVTPALLRSLDWRSLRLQIQWGQLNDSDRDLVFWLCDDLRVAFAPRSLTSLDMGCQTFVHVEDSLRKVGQFLVHACSRTMQHLSFPATIESGLASSYPSEQANFWRVVHLHSFTSIETFELTLMVPTPGHRPPRAPLGTVCVAIIALLPRSLREVTISLRDVKEASQIKSKKMLDLGTLDDALDARAPVLEKVRVVFRGLGQWYLVEFAMAAMKVMSKCRRRGILEIVRWDYDVSPM